MQKIILTKKTHDPVVVHPSSHRLFENAQGGPYRFGVPLEFNREVANRIRQGRI